MSVLSDHVVCLLLYFYPSVCLSIHPPIRSVCTSWVASMSYHMCDAAQRKVHKVRGTSPWPIYELCDLGQVTWPLCATVYPSLK